MKNKAALGLVSAGLVAGLTIGSIGIATAANTVSSTKASTAATQSAPGQQDPGGRGHGGPDGAARGHQGFGGMGDLDEALANLTKLSQSDIEAQETAGKTLAQIASAKGVTTDQLIAETTKIETAELDAAVKTGTLTAAEKTEVLSSMQSNLEKAINEIHTGRGPGGHDGGPRGSSATSATVQ